MKVQVPSRATGVVLGGDFSDPTNERLIYLSAFGLVLLGLILLIGTILWWRRGRQEHPALAPLELMGTRSWVKSPEGDRRRRLDHVRLAGAGGAASERVVGEPVDLRALVRNMPAAFDDLREPGDVDASIEPQVDDVASAEEAEAQPSGAGEPAPTGAEPHAPALAPSPDAEVDATLIATKRPADDTVSSPDGGDTPSAEDEDPVAAAGDAQPDVDEQVVSVEAMSSGTNDPAL